MVENALPREWWMDEVWRKEGWWEQEEVGAQVRRSSDQSIGTGRRRRGIMFSTKTESPSLSDAVSSSRRLTPIDEPCGRRVLVHVAPRSRHPMAPMIPPSLESITPDRVSPPRVRARLLAACQ